MKSHSGVAAAIISVTTLALGACTDQINMLKARKEFQACER